MTMHAAVPKAVACAGLLGLAVLWIVGRAGDACRSRGGGPPVHGSSDSDDARSGDRSDLTTSGDEIARGSSDLRADSKYPVSPFQELETCVRGGSGKFARAAELLDQVSRSREADPDRWQRVQALLRYDADRFLLWVLENPVRVVPDLRLECWSALEHVRAKPRCDLVVSAIVAESDFRCASALFDLVSYNLSAYSAEQLTLAIRSKAETPAAIEWILNRLSIDRRKLSRDVLLNLVGDPASPSQVQYLRALAQRTAPTGGGLVLPPSSASHVSGSLQTGDLVTCVDGLAVTSKSAWTSLMASCQTSEQRILQVDVWRRGELLQIQVPSRDLLGIDLLPLNLK